VGGQIRVGRKAIASLATDDASVRPPSSPIGTAPVSHIVPEEFDEQNIFEVMTGGQVLVGPIAELPSEAPGIEELPKHARLSIVIPTLNEAENVSNLILRIETLFTEEPQIIVVDDNSSDGTVDSVLAMSERFRRIRVLRRPGRGGIGSAVRDGIRFALEHSDSERVVTMDADWSHDPSQLPALLEAAGDADFVQGSRYAEGGEIVGWPATRRLLSILGNNACRFLFRTGLREHTTFYRVFSRECAQLIVANVQDDGYAWGVRSLVVAVDAGLRAREVPITFVERANGESKLGIREMIGWVFSIVRLLGQPRGIPDRFDQSLSSGPSR